MDLGINIINKSIHLIVSLLVLISCGGGSNSDSLNIENISEASSSNVEPTTLLTSNKTLVVSGDSFILSWSSTNASSCSASGSWSGSKSLSGSQRLASDSYGDHTFYLNCSGAIASIEINVTDEDNEGSCTNPHNAKIKESYLGNFDIPIPQGLFGEDHLKAIGFKDYGVKWIYQNYKGRNAAWISDCTEQEYIKLMYRTALRQLKENGVETAWIYNFGYWEDYQAETWKINHSRKHIEDWTVEFIANTAKEMDMNMHYAWQFLALDDENNMLFPFDGMVYVDMPLLKKILDSHEEHILWEADRLESLGVGSISADWSAMYVCFCGLQNELDQQERDQLKSYYAERMGSIVSHIKSRFSGEIYLGEGIIFNDSRLFNEVDGVIGSFPNMLEWAKNKQQQ